MCSSACSITSAFLGCNGHTASLSQQDQVHGAWPASTEPMVGVYSHAQPITQPSLRRLNCLQARRWDERDAERGRRR